MVTFVTPHKSIESTFDFLSCFLLWLHLSKRCISPTIGDMEFLPLQIMHLIWRSKWKPWRFFSPISYLTYITYNVLRNPYRLNQFLYHFPLIWLVLRYIRMPRPIILKWGAFQSTLLLLMWSISQITKRWTAKSL